MPPELDAGELSVGSGSSSTPQSRKAYTPIGLTHQRGGVALVHGASFWSRRLDLANRGWHGHAHGLEHLATSHLGVRP